MDKQTLARLFHELEPVLAQNGYELLDIRWLSESGKWVMRVYIDHLLQTPQPAEEQAKTPRRITVHDCASTSRLLGPILDVADVEGRYSLEVSSPGLDRPLRTRRAFERAVGETVRIKLSVPLEDRRNFKGVLLAVEGDMLRLQLQDDTQREFVFPLGSIEQAVIIGQI